MASHLLIKEIAPEFIRGGCIVEIGSSREPERKGKSSTYYFNWLGNKIGADFYTVDFADDSYELAKSLVGDRAFQGDGAEFIKQFAKVSSKKIDVLYLDNYDVIYNEEHKADLERRVGDDYAKKGQELNNTEAARVHLDQMKAALRLMAKRSIVICDDTLLDENGQWWGKCATVVPFLESRGWKIIGTSEVGVMLASPKMKNPEHSRPETGLGKRNRWGKVISHPAPFNYQ
jgi:hypothetical protein